MKIVLDCFDVNIELKNNKIAVAEVLNKKLFSKVCQSLVSGNMEDAVIPYLIYDNDNKKLSSKDYDMIFNPFKLPWDEKQTTKILYEKFNTLMMEDEDLRQEIEEINSRLINKLQILSYGLDSDFCFKNIWSIQKYLAMLKLVPDVNEDDLLLDNLVKFLDFRKDLNINKILIFVNLKNFLNKNDLESLFKHVIYSKIPVFLLENCRDNITGSNESKYIIDQDFLEEYQ